MTLKIFENRIASGLITPVIAGVVLGILAPFGTAGFETGFRFIYWISLTLAGGLGAMAARAILKRLRPQTSIWIGALVQSLGATAAVAPFVIGLSGFGGFFGVAVTLFYIWVVAIVVTSFGELAGRRSVAPEMENMRPALLDRLPPKFQDATLYAISSEDHYVRIHSAAGEHMLLMRLTDAEDLAAPLLGLKPHRSWWVAEAGVESVTKSGGKTTITLKSGIIVPVSREGAKRVRDAAWA